MAVVFLVLILYHLPLWSEKPSGIFGFLLLVVSGLLIDCAASLLRHKRLWCCVSGAVTAALISLLTDGVPIWGQLLGVATALILGKHLWGGTGKNLLNPAMLGLLAVFLFFDIPYPYFTPSLLLIPAVLLSLLFLGIRPFAGIGFMLGMIAALIFYQELSLDSILAYGVFFWGCLVLTDPVTVTPHPVAGLAAGFLSGFAALYYFPVPVAVIAGVLAVNLFSGAIDSLLKKEAPAKARIRIPKVFSHSHGQPAMLDLTGEAETPGTADATQLSSGEILNRIRENAVFGMGGAAFPTYKKLMALIEADKAENYLIINGAECDPGLIHDDWLLKNCFHEISKGAELLNNCIKFKSIHLAVKKKPEFLETQLIRIHQVHDRYPAGAEKILIEEVLGKRLGNDVLPAGEGILVLNVQTLYAISRAVLQNKKTDTRFLTVANLKNKTAQVVKVRLGMKLREIMESVYPGVVNIYAGGGIMQAKVAEEDAVADPTVNFIAAGPLPNFKGSPQCSRCGSCGRNCPKSLKVNAIAELVEQGKLKETLKYRANECISCGCCSYSCPAGRNLAAKVKQAKDAVR
jgi:ferredoxin